MTEDGEPVAHGERPEHEDRPGYGDRLEQQRQGEVDAVSQEEKSQSAGRIRYQDPESTAPREPTLAEKRARERTEQRQREEHEAALAAAERRSQNRRRVLIGSGVTVGVVALVASFYSAVTYTQNRDAVTQYCSTAQGGQAIAEAPQNCDPEYVTSHGGHVSGGMFFIPYPLPFGGVGMHQYRYGYTQPGSPPPRVGATVQNPSFVKPSSATIKNQSGTTVQRGGFGISGKGSSGS